MIIKTDIAVIGGDMRQIYLANELTDKKYTVYYYGKQSDILDYRVKKAASLSEILHNCSIVICPIPLTGNKTDISGLDGIESSSVSALLGNLKSNHVLFGGLLGSDIIKHCEENGIFFCDIAKRNDFSILNSVATAEGAIAYAIEASPECLHKSSCLVLGFGRCAATLADRLRGLNANVTVCNRTGDGLLKAEVCGFKTINLEALGHAAGGFDFIFNTIPALVLNRQILLKVNKNVVITDIASAPGGVDFEAAKELSLNAFLYLGIPGKVSPKNAGKIISNVILNTLEERRN